MMLSIYIVESDCSGLDLMFFFFFAYFLICHIGFQFFTPTKGLKDLVEQFVLHTN